jgi:hypothetical protein
MVIFLNSELFIKNWIRRTFEEFLLGL